MHYGMFLQGCVTGSTKAAPVSDGKTNPVHLPLSAFSRQNVILYTLTTLT
ncbi:hypothetical protein EXN66_Car004295 [Channa argus]|uniref:Uncharacterized protein n=1 Tax=Channa argus TaxID=215402 RepID=A0A6G1PEK0_CHAAH|nr:hypothetical protein EXN66_Car004295 [Channa argus]